MPMAAETVANSGAELMSFDERWAAWVAKGVERDRRMKKRAIVTASAVAAATLLSLIIALLR
jgi:hypothetical protein